jgi:hypothetical protein
MSQYIILYNARGILFVDDSNHTRFFQYHKIPISGRFLKVTSERDIPVFSKYNAQALNTLQSFLNH